MHPKVGIIMVTYNRADVTCLALDALATIPQTVPTKIFLIDNKSKKKEFLRIKESAEYLKGQGLLDLEFIASDKNLGFAAGNNIGLEKAFADKSITHLCLLNNDTVVTPYWLDRLLAYNSEGLLGPITNSVGNEQLVPMRPWPAAPNGYLKQVVWDFSEHWYADHKGQVRATEMLGFFCVFGKKSTFEKIGLLDTAFGVGTFEDDDYCYRAKQLTFPLDIARDVFVYHWGSASFSTLRSRALAKLVNRNKRIFEQKHKTTWKNPVASIHKAYRAEMENQVHGVDAELRKQNNLSGYEKMMSSQIEFLNRPFDPLNPKRRSTALKLTVPYPVWMFLYFFVAMAKYVLRQHFRKNVHFKMSQWKRAVARTLRKKKGLVLQKLFRGKNNLVCFPICAYAGRRQRPQQIIDRLAPRFDKVFWVTPFGSHIRGAMKLKENLYEVYLCEKINNFYTDQPPLENDTELDASMLSQLVPRKGRVTVVVQSPYWNAHLQILKRVAKKNKTHVRVIYDCMDLHSGFGSALKVNHLHEENIIQVADVLVASSDVIERALKKYNRPLQQIKNGCSPKDFPLMANVPRKKKVGYFGAIAEWFDIQMVSAAAQHLPDHTFELIGDYSIVASKLGELPKNMVFVGEKPFFELKNYAKDWDVAMIPFVITPLIEATNPVKLYEYLSLGLPIVSSPIPEVMASGADVLIANSGEDLAKAIVRAIEVDTSEKREKRRQFAEKHDWNQRAELFANAIFDGGLT